MWAIIYFCAPPRECSKWPFRILHAFTVDQKHGIFKRTEHENGGTPVHSLVCHGGAGGWGWTINSYTIYTAIPRGFGDFWSKKVSFWSPKRAKKWPKIGQKPRGLYGARVGGGLGPHWQPFEAIFGHLSHFGPFWAFFDPFWSFGWGAKAPSGSGPPKVGVKWGGESKLAGLEDPSGV